MAKEYRNKEEHEITRVRTPRGREILGIVEQRFGGMKMLVKCLDGIARNCRIPGRYKRKLWIREGNIVLVEPWEFDNNKGDIIFKYHPAAVDWLKKKGYLKEVSDEF
ncbi:MAG: translation initiation factor eIF-1A [archaeon]